MLIYGNTPKDITKMLFRNKTKVLLFVGAVVLAVSLGTSKAESADKKLSSLEQFFDALGSGNVPQMGMDNDMVNPGNDKIISVIEAPYNGFNWDWYIQSCESNRSYDGTINKIGTFDILEQAKIEAGGIPCPVGHPVFHPSWDYDWRTHIAMARVDRIMIEFNRDSREDQYGLIGPQARRIQYKVE